MRAFDYHRPKSVKEAVSLLRKVENAKLLAGGQSLIPSLKLRLSGPPALVDLGAIEEMRGIKLEGGTLTIGALATHYQIESSKLLAAKCPLLPQTARAIGDVQVRNRGTIGGSLIHADPSADWPAAILALGGDLKLSGPNGERRIAAEKFFLGTMTTAIEPTEILTEIRVPASPRRSGSVYLKMPQPASGFAIVGAAVWLRLDTKGRCDDIRVGVTGLGDKPFCAHAVEERLRGSKLTPKLIEEVVSQVVLDVAADVEDDEAREGADHRLHDGDQGD